MNGAKKYIPPESLRILYSENLPLQINIQKMDSIFRNKLKLIDL
jgi:hypothetical protein